MRRYVIAVISIATFFACTFYGSTAASYYVASAASAQGTLRLFDTEAAAQAHCPRDEVVWLSTNTGIYHEKGMRWHGRTKHGAYVCRKEANAAGDRDTRNGQ